MKLLVQVWTLTLLVAVVVSEITENEQSQNDEPIREAKAFGARDGSEAIKEPSKEQTNVEGITDIDNTTTSIIPDNTTKEIKDETETSSEKKEKKEIEENKEPVKEEENYRKVRSNFPAQGNLQNVQEVKTFQNQPQIVPENFNVPVQNYPNVQDFNEQRPIQNYPNAQDIPQPQVSNVAAIVQPVLNENVRPVFNENVPPVLNENVQPVLNENVEHVLNENVQPGIEQIKDGYYQELISNQNNLQDPSIQSKNNQFDSSNQVDSVRYVYVPVPINFNPNLKDVFKYNPAFDYLKKDASQDFSNNYHDEVDFNEEDKPNPNVKRRIQYYQTVYQPNSMYFYNMFRQNSPGNLVGGPGNFPQSVQDSGNFPQSIQNSGNFPQSIPNPGNQEKFGNLGNPIKKIYDEYFPIVIQNPFNAMWSAFTNIVEYGPQADVCSKKKRRKTAGNRRGRELDGELMITGDEDIGQDVTTELFMDLARTADPGPQIRRLKVRRGGVAIAGPGGIATAGSGGTAIVGPGGTAYTKEDGTAIVGPGGRLVHVPDFLHFPFFKNRGGDARTFEDPPGSKFVAMGPLIYYNVPNQPQ